MFEIRPGRESDRPQILELIRQVFGQAQAKRAERRWQWQWQDDPRLAEPGYHGMVAEWNGRVIANLSGIPAGLYLDGQPVEAWWYADVLVHWGSVRRALREQKRSGGGQTGPRLAKGIATAMLDHPAAGRIQMGKHLTDAMQVVGYQANFTDQPQTGSWSRLVSFRQPLERFVGCVPARALGWLGDLAIPRIQRPALPVTVLEGVFDARFDRLWEQAKTAYPAIGRRDSAFLNWRYRQHPDLTYTVLTVSVAGALRGYLVYLEFFRHEQRRAAIIDSLAGPDDGAVLDALLAKALQNLRRAAVHRVECYAGGNTLTAALQRARFKARLHNGKVQSTLVRGLPAVELYVTRGDGDGG